MADCEWCSPLLSSRRFSLATSKSLFLRERDGAFRLLACSCYLQSYRQKQLLEPSESDSQIFSLEQKSRYRHMGKQRNRKAKPLKSILPDCLDPIDESIEESESSSIHSENSEPGVDYLKPGKETAQHTQKDSNQPEIAKQLDEEKQKYCDNPSFRSAGIVSGELIKQELLVAPFFLQGTPSRFEENLHSTEESGSVSPSIPNIRNEPVNSDITKHTVLASMITPTENVSNKSILAVVRDDSSAPLFNYDDDFDTDAVDPETEEEQLTWRMDPSKSLSDWKIKVTNKETRQNELYHVHKNLLAVGPKKSEYFVRIFRTNNRLDVGTSTTDIFMESVAAHVIPQWLDFLYSPDDELVIDTQSATGLRHLAQFFGMRSMHKKAMEFIVQDLSMTNVIVYYKDSVVLADDKISELAANHCSNNILSIDSKHELLTTVDPFFFRRLMTGPEIDSRKKQYHISSLLAEYCALNSNVLDEQSFERLTDEKYLPLVDRNAALTLLELEADLVLINSSEEEKSELTSLQLRCIKDLTLYWQELEVMEHDRIMRVCRKLPSTVVADLLVKSLTQAKKKVDEVEAQSAAQTAAVKLTRSGSAKSLASEENSKADYRDMSSKSDNGKMKEVRKEYDAKMSSLKREHQKSIDKIQRDFESKLLKLRDICVEKDKHIANYWDELKRFQRLPNQPEGKIIPSGLMAKATKMPEIGNQPPDGYLLVGKGKTPSKYPVFFYNGDQV